MEKDILDKLELKNNENLLRKRMKDNIIGKNRDLNYLNERGYKCKEVQPVDMFPHSVHIENVALIVKEK